MKTSSTGSRDQGKVGKEFFTAIKTVFSKGSSFENKKEFPKIEISF
ncbi:MAG: hypothetical protein ACQEWV_07170 [Bacillota bacterium]